MKTCSCKGGQLVKHWILLRPLKMFGLGLYMIVLYGNFIFNLVYESVIKILTMVFFFFFLGKGNRVFF